MSKIPVTAIFDIGKTNKKFFLFDAELNEVFSTYTRFEAVLDEDDFPSEPLLLLSEWMLSTFKNALENLEYEIQYLNFSCHGASFVHIDDNGDPATPLYDYLKPYPEELLARFYEENGGKMNFCRKTSSPPLAMLNSGLQLYFIKYAKPELFKKIKHSFHFPQYLCYLFTGEMVSDYTSIGCHTALWDFEKNEYHEWVKRENITDLLPPILPGNTILTTLEPLGNIACGIGVHDSSAALLPYLEQNKDPFALLSTGTWSICINPFNKSNLTKKELKQDCLQFLSVKGLPIKISRLFIGEEHKFQIEKLYQHFKLPQGTYKKLRFNAMLAKQIFRQPTKRFRFKHLTPEVYGLRQAACSDLDIFGEFHEAYYTFIHELTEMQVAAIKLVLKDNPVEKLYIDGGFNANDIFVEMLRRKLPHLSIITSDFPNGSALGAAMLVSSKQKV
jgi:sugar (pentulose or hexulose) kinase